MRPVRFHNLKWMARSAAHYRASLDDEAPDSALLRAGRLGHKFVLEENLKHEVAGNLVVYDGERRGNAWKAFKAAHAGKDIVTIKEHDKIRPLAEAVLGHAEAAKLLEGEREHELEWSWLGRECAGRPDVIHPDRIVELKLTGDGQPDRFQRTGLRLGYHAQLAWYRIGAHKAKPQPLSRTAWIICVEMSPPYVITIRPLTPRALEQGEKLCRLWMERVLTCEAGGYWPGYCESVVPFDAPDDELLLMIDGEEVAA